jgi:hypothetical protein
LESGSFKDVSKPNLGTMMHRLPPCMMRVT